MPLKIDPPPAFITNPDGSAVATRAPVVPTSVFGASQPATVGGVPGITPVLTSLLNALGAEGVITNACTAPGTPAAAAGANAGTAPPAPVMGAGSTDDRGTITFGTGATPAAGVMVVVTFGNLNIPSNPRIQLTANNAATQALGLYNAAKSNAGFSLGAAVAPAASQANTVYSFDFEVEA